MAELIFVRRGEEVMFYQLDGKTTKLGRGADNDIAFPAHEHYISHNHAVIESRMGSYWLRDLSGQGIEVNHEMMREGRLEDGDRFALGRWEVVFQLQSRGRSGGKTLARQGGDTLPLATEDGLKSIVGAALTFQKGGTTRTAPIGESAFNIGSDDQNELCLDLSYVSSFHCRIYRKKGRYFIRDLDSLNKTLVNGVEVVESELPDGAEIALGKFRLTFHHVSDDEVPASGEEWPGFAGLVSEDPAMDRVFGLIQRVAQTDAPVLIMGESGTGKELVAQAIHASGPRDSRPFVALNCGAISRELIESAMFGHERGAFTGAVQARRGAFEEAEDGTLFLDEIGDMPLEQQVTMLRVLEGGSFRRVGGAQDLKSQARVVTATHRDLRKRAADGHFREDLYYRIGVLQIQIPPLRERASDIPLLARFFLHKFAGPRTLQLSDEAMARLQAHSWPGNVRELRNVMQRALVMAEHPVIQADELAFEPQIMRGDGPADVIVETHADDVAHASAPATGPASLDDAERQAILNALEAANGVVSDAARTLGIGRSSMYSKMKRLGIEHRKK